MLIQDYQDRWADDFIRIKEILLEANKDLHLEVEHIGSTSVPGISAKPIIDIDLVYHSWEEFDKIKANLEVLGYYHNGDQGVAGREVFKRRVAANNHELLDSIRHHLYACHQSSEELKRHLIFREALKSSKSLREEYKQLKLSLAGKAGQNKEKYAELKEREANAFFNSVFEKNK